MTEAVDSPTVDGDLLTLQQAADRLKVHYMTAYRWVRKGELPAFKAGGRLRVRTADLERFVSDREVDVARPSAQGQGTDWPTHVDRLHALLLGGEGVEAGNLVRKVVSDGASAGDAYLRLLAPALHRIGEDWAAGRITVADEHRATEIVSAIMARLSEFFRRRGPTRGTAVTLTAPGDHHAVPARMVADFLRAGGFDVHHLGPDVPLEDLTLFLQVVPNDVVCVSMSTPDLDKETERNVVAACRAALPDALVVFGGRGHRPERARAAGAESVEDLAELTERLDALLESRTDDEPTFT
ncbi:helix-turn-helix domain-containing protein [Egibacter rhizosphaerae]|uniref:Helix-turn-helix domain-containing protein n=1 Tax=Egibacter rhizosphaerae TaxID=1670831 RepID=A0A411YE96_9ACTN|nr:helix-turn-helix domain-containing protein [Egibacter rhizosphaerae]QBI19427.1 helix-turn-helix domain-containing protein [Egibacter rhizosphaerae]